MLNNSILLSQDLNWNDKPVKGLVYEISNDEAQKLLTRNKKDTFYFDLIHTLVDTFNVREGWLNRPEKGHFILVTIHRNKLHFQYTCEFPYQVFLFKEYGTLSLQVLDSNGVVREDAKVKLGYKKIKIDKESRVYRVDNQWVKNGNIFATVELDGFRSVFNIQKHKVPAWNNNYHEDDGPDFYSYLITDKNKYRPNEKVRFKSYALNGSKWPLKKKLDVYLTGNRKSIKIATIEPHRAGSYAGEFILHDSLNLRLDRTYSLQLRQKWGRTVSTCYFKYEDYELFENELDIKLKHNLHYHPDTNILTINATDVNGLLLKDARAEIKIEVIDVLETFTPAFVMPTIIMDTNLTLDPAGPTEIEIPSSVFGLSNTSYRVLVSVYDSKNERIERTQRATHNYSRFNLVSAFESDSTVFRLFHNEKEMLGIPAKIVFDNEKADSVLLPFRSKTNPSIRNIYVESAFASRDFNMSQLIPDIKLSGGVETDSFNVKLENKHGLDISWFIYQGSKLIDKGFGKEMNHSSLIENRDNSYYVELFYSFGGKEHTYQRQFRFREDHLDISLDIPNRIYPGQKVDATIHVKNYLGAPVKGADLTAMAYNSMLNYHLPDLPYYGQKSKSRSKADHFSKQTVNKNTTVVQLPYSIWKYKAGLDTMLYYQFTFPEDKMFSYAFEIDDSTQFAPFVMRDGYAQDIYVVEVDRLPVYFNWTTHPKEYSFYANPNEFHTVSLRLSDRVLVFDSLKFNKGNKSIISVDLDNLPENVKVIMLENKFSAVEKERYYQRISVFKGSQNHYSYLNSDYEFIPLFNRSFSNYWKQVVAGPLAPESKTYFEEPSYSITYRHKNNFTYKFEDNVVYQMNSSYRLPDFLFSKHIDPMPRIDDLKMTRKQFVENQTVKIEEDRWHPKRIIALAEASRLRIDLPEEKYKSGIGTILFENCATGEIQCPVYLSISSKKISINKLDNGWYNAYLVYNSGKYLKMDSVPWQEKSRVNLNFEKVELHKSDSISVNWLMTYKLLYKPEYNYSPSELKSKQKEYIYYSGDGNVHGTVYGEEGEPLPGVSIVIKGTNVGTVTNLDGYFSIHINDYHTTLVISFIGCVTEEVEVMPGSEVAVNLTYDICALEEVIVVGYGTSKKSNLTGSVSIISEDMQSIPEEEIVEEVADQEAERKLYNELQQLNTIRNNFSDVGFWEPKLFTDKNGQATFSITFPDDITQWNTLVYAMNRRLQTGTYRKKVNSYKPLVAELLLPRFLTQGDSSYAVGRVLNHTSDSLIKGEVYWKNQLDSVAKSIDFKHFHSEKILLHPERYDTLKSRFVFARNDGYMDGEERIIPVIEQGVERADGTLDLLLNGDSITLTAGENENLHVELINNQVDFYKQEVRYLINYRYACNEQLASKLIGLINHKYVAHYEDNKFHYDYYVKKIIKKLLRNQNKEFLWSWWNKSENTSYWMSAHILRALKYAKDAGYEVKLNIENLARKASYKYEFLGHTSFYDIDLLHAMATWGVEFDYKATIKSFEEAINDYEWEEQNRLVKYPYYLKRSLLKEKLMLQEIKQILGDSLDIELFNLHLKKGIKGEMWFAEKGERYYWYNNELTTNTIAYRIIKNEPNLQYLKAPMQLYFINSRKKGSWNTYYSSNIVMSILPDLLESGMTKKQNAGIQLSGRENGQINTFPYKVTLHPGDSLEIIKQSGMPVYIMQYNFERVTAAKKGIEGFEISTYFENYQNKLKAGEPVKQIVEVLVKNDASSEYVMIDVPIPASCSYAGGSPIRGRAETHREQFKERTVIFCERMKPGTYRFEINLIPRFTGKYFINPAQVSLMYIPVVNANTDMKRVEIIDR